MDPFEQYERKQLARHRIRAQRERAGRLKARVVAISLICFALLWGVVFVQMATGNDPVLGDSSSSTSPRGTAGATATRRPGNRPKRMQAPPPKGSDAATDSERLETAEADEELEPVEEVGVEPEEELIEEEPAPVTTSQS